MEAETVVVLLLSGIFVGFIAWLAIHTRSHSANQDTGGIPANPAEGAKPTEVQTLEERAKNNRKEGVPSPSPP